MKTKNTKHEMLFNLGSTLRMLRMRKGFKSAEVFSYENDLNRTAYWRWENGENLTMKNFFKLCDIHNISPKDLFEILENKKGIVKKEIMLNEPGSVLFKKVNR
jgi:transcriptional regulator with XRE-family HTH domain